MSGFRAYLLSRPASQTPMGDFVGDAQADRSFPDAHDLPELLSYLDRRNACGPAIEAAKKWWAKFVSAPAAPTTELYRHFDAGGQLLYVGISLSAVRRLSQHSGASSWFHEIARIEIERFPSRQEALSAERLAIRQEAPLYNVAGVGSDQ